MAVSVNLQEVFSSDSQSNLTQKINFNFNQLLTLGLGQPGPPGPTSGPGPIGPVGPIGADGKRGSIVFAITSTGNPILDPNLVQNSEDGDIFINTRELYVKGVTVSGVWGQVVNFQSLVNSESLQDTYKLFQLGVGSGDSASKHGKLLRTNGIDISNDSFATSHPMYYVDGETVNNTQLVLSNFDELKTWRIQNDELIQNSSETDATFEYTAITNILSFLPSSLSGWKHQLELGSVDELGITVGSGYTQAYVLTPTEQNLKFKKYRVAAAGLTGSLYNRADIDLSGSTASVNSLNSEIIFATNKKTGSSTQILEMGLTNAKILGSRLTSQALDTDGLIISRAGTHHLAFGFDDTITNRINLRTSSNITNIQVNNVGLNLLNGNLTVSLVDPAKEINIGNAVKVKSNRLSQGLPFPATMVASADPNTLDDYEEGTWTPTLEFTDNLVYGADNNDTGALSVISAIGHYVKIGKSIYLRFSISVRFRLDQSSSGLPDLVANAINLGFTTTSVAAVGTESYGLIIGGLPFGKSDGIADFNIQASILDSSQQSLRSKVLHAIAGASTVSIQPIAPGTIFGRHACVGSPSPIPKIKLYGSRYSSVENSDRLNGTISRFTAHDLLKDYPGSYTTITGSGWIFDAGNCITEEVFDNGEFEEEETTTTLSTTTTTSTTTTQSTTTTTEFEEEETTTTTELEEETTTTELEEDPE